MSAQPARYAVIGHPVDHSRSPAIHGAFAEQTGQRLTYELLASAVDAFEATAACFFTHGGAGLNVTLPFKQQAAFFADRLSERAERAGAVNTLIHAADGRITGDNTDGVGLVRDLIDNLGMTLRDRYIVVLGAGGAVRGVVPALLQQQPARLTIANRSPEKAQAIANACGDLGNVSACSLAQLKPGAQLIVNAISAGLAGEMPELPADMAHNLGAVYDMLYADRPTPFLRWAHGQGVTARADGFGMLVEQAAESFYLWRGVRPATAPVIRALRPA